MDDHQFWFFLHLHVYACCKCLHVLMVLISAHMMYVPLSAVVACCSSEHLNISPSLASSSAAVLLRADEM